jgi:hypothetical protein
VSFSNIGNIFNFFSVGDLMQVWAILGDLRKLWSILIRDLMRF